MSSAVQPVTTPALGPISKDSVRQRKWGVVRWISPIALLALWQLGSALGVIPADVLPAPSLIAEAGVELVRSGELSDALRGSGIRVLEGLLLGGVLGVA